MLVSGGPAALVGLIAAVLAAVIGRLGWVVNQGQLDVAREKLRQDLFERRFAVFYAFQTLLLAVAMNKPEVEEAVSDTVAKLATARFLFDPDAYEYLRDTFTSTANLHNSRELFNDLAAWDKPKERADAMSKHAADKIAFFAKIDEISTKLAPTLRLSDLKTSQADFG